MNDAAMTLSRRLLLMLLPALSACWAPKGIFIPVDAYGASVPGEYVISPGDTLQVRVFQHGNHYFELEQFLDGPQAGMMILKTSVDTSRETVELPPFVKVAREVTDDVKYSTFAIANKT